MPLLSYLAALLLLNISVKRSGVGSQEGKRRFFLQLPWEHWSASASQFFSDKTILGKGSKKH